MPAQREKLIVEAEDRASRTFDKMSNNWNKAAGLIKKAAGAAGIGFAIAKVGELAVASTKMAIDAQEAGSAFATTYGEALPQASRFVEEFANTAGLARFELEQMLAVNGNVLQGIGATETQAAAMSESMARLAGDVASFSNAAGGSQAVLLALQSAMNGEREALKTYGLAISEAEVVEQALLETQKARATELTRLEKAQATMTLATEKAGKAVGDLERTQDSAANTLRRINARWKEAQVALGNAMLPALERALPAIEKIVPALESLAPALGQVAEQLGEVAQNAASVGGPVIRLIGFLGEADAMVRGRLVNGLSSFVRESFGTAFSAVGDGVMDLARGLGLAAGEYDNIADKIDATDAANRAATIGWTATGNAAGEVTGAMQAAQTWTERAAAATAESAGEQELWASVSVKAARAAEAQARAQEELKRKHDAAKAALVAYADEQRAAVDPMFALNRAVQGVRDAEADLAEATKEHGATSDEAIQAVIALAEAEADLKFRAAELDAGLANNIASFRGLLEEMGITDEAVQQIIDSILRYNDTPIEPKTFLMTVAGSAAGVASGEAVKIVGGNVALAKGGTVPGPLGSAQPIIAHGGEEVLNPSDARMFRALMTMLADRTESPTQIDQSKHVTVQVEGSPGGGVSDDIDAATSAALLVELL